ncbi:YidC/Oxa1 family membrane protein insertase [Candidatus Margulisiibacteriota bacterium]
MYFLPIMMYFLCLTMPSGVLIYWSLSNILTVAQQKFMVKEKAAT